MFPAEIVPEMGRLGLLGAHLSGYGCPGRSAVEYGLAALELEAGDSGLRTFVSVQGSLAMSAIHKFGTEAHKERWLPGMAAGDLIGCFGLTEPEAGSDPASMTTTARREADGWVLNGAKRWIGLASIADVAVIWARTGDGIRGFLVPTATPGFSATPIEPKLAMRASIQCDITLTGVRVPADAILPGAGGLRGPFSCLNEARYCRRWVSWPVIPAMSSKSLSTCRTVSRSVSAVAAISRSGIDGARCCPCSARLRSTATARFSAAGVKYSTGISDNGGRSSSSPMSPADLAEYPASSSVTVVTCTKPRSMRSAHNSRSWQSPRRTRADLSISHGRSVTTTLPASRPGWPGHGQADRLGAGLRS